MKKYTFPDLPPLEDGDILYIMDISKKGKNAAFVAYRERLEQEVLQASAIDDDEYFWRVRPNYDELLRSKKRLSIWSRLRQCGISASRFFSRC